MSWFTDKVVNPLKKLWNKLIHKDDPATPSTPPVEPPVEPPAEPPATSGNKTFLWKPASTSRQGRAAVMLPALLTATTITVNGQAPKESAGRCPDAGDNRQTYFMASPGSAYGANVKVVAYAGSAVLHTWTIPNGASRWSQDYN